MSLPISSIISLKADYKAAGDGVTDDSAAIKNFLDDLATNGGTGIIEPGIYLSGNYSLDNNAKPFSVMGSGMGASIFKNKSQTFFMRWRNCNGINIEGLSFDCQYTSVAPVENARKHGVIFSSCQNIKVENCSVYDFLGSGFMAFKATDGQQCTNISFKNCFAQATQAFNEWQAATTREDKLKKLCNGVLLSDCDYSEISDCCAEDISLFGIELKNYSRWNKVNHNRAKNCLYGFGMGQQTKDDTGSEHNIVEGFQAENCYLGGILGKASYNIISDFRVDFNGKDPSTIQNAFRFQLKSRFNSLNNLLVSALPANKVAILYESGANNNVSTISFCKNNSTDDDVIVARYNNTEDDEGNIYVDTINNYTLLYRSDAASDKLKVSGNSIDNNRSKYAWDNIDIPATS